MIDASYPVTVYCPVSNTERTVFFLPKENGIGYSVTTADFNGCEEESGNHPQCEDCRFSAFEIMREQVQSK